MALIGTLRNKMGTWVVVFVFVAISAFVLNDLFSGQSAIFSSTSNEVGEIAGRDISLDEYQQAIREREANYFLNFNREPGERERPLIQEQAWEMLIARNAVQAEYDKVGIDVTSDEVWDMIQGKNVDENLKSTPIFLNEAGLFDKDRVVTYLNQIKTMPENSEPRIRWELFQRDLAPARERIKYENLLLKASYTTTAEAERDYHLQNDVAEVKYMYIPFYFISDSAATPTDQDFKNYYDKNKEKYKSEHTRDISYVAFPVVPSSEDSAAIKKELIDLVDDFKQAQDDSTFASINSDSQTPFQKYTPALLPPYVNPDSLVTGKVYGPILDGNTYKVVKISEVGQDTVYNARARHILIRWTDDPDNATLEANKREAKEKARGILREIKGGADFAAKAREHGTDGTASRGGDLGWFPSGEMVKPFDDAVFGATRPGLLNDVVETEYGYHIMDVTDTKDNTAYWIGVLEREIVPSDESINGALRKAESFQADLTGVSEFNQKAQKEGLTVMEAKNIKTADRRVGILGDSREVVQWLFRDASLGEVSQVFDLQDQYAVAVMTGEVKKGYKSLETVKEEITPAVRNEVKGRLIAEKLKSLSGTLEEIAQTFGSDANVFNSSDLKLNTNSLPSVGFDPQAVGKAFSLENGKRSEPLISENGVVIIEMQNKTIAPELEDYSTHKTQLEQTASNQSSFNIAEAIKENADIVDSRYKFY